MAFNTKESEIIKWGLANGKSKQQVEQAITNFRTGVMPTKLAELEQKPTTVGGIVRDAAGDYIQIGKDISNSSQRRAENIQEIRGTLEGGGKGNVPAILEVAGQLAGSGADAIGAVFKGVAKMVLPPKTEAKTKELVANFGKEVMEIPEVKGIVNWYGTLPQDKKDALDAAGGVVSLASEFIGLGVAKKGVGVVKEGVEQGVTAGVTATKRIASETANTVKTAVANVADAGATSGVVQTGKELLERVPRAAGRATEAIAKAEKRAIKIKEAAPEVANAIKSNLDDRIINTVVEADAPTREAYRRVLTVAEETPKTIGMKRQPTIIGGELAEEQFNLITKQKKLVGSQIGDRVKELSKTVKVNMDDGFAQIDDTLKNQGIKFIETKTGTKLSFRGTKFTPAERTRIQELYNLATEGGDTLTPRQIYLKDQLFSKLQREAKFEGVGDLIVETAEGNRSLFKVFRDIYSNKLDGVSPEIRGLNKQYRELAVLTEDLEDSIFKTPNFNATKTIDPSEFAKVNLRRIFGEAQSSPAFEAVADAMDAFSRKLGYQGATPKAVAEFAQEMRKLFPDSIPKTGFTGGIKAGLGDIIETISKAGTPNTADQIKALKELLNRLP